ncbi:MAG: rRNA maturation RNase YbeY [Bacteroidales bacterium]|nr:rRNA maturation RNase YbeY [Bacteroidales bacterium]
MNFSINFFNEDVPYRIKNKRLVKDWIRKTILKENKTPGDINIILCSDDFLHTMNNKYLQHDELTDIITFDNSECDSISGDLYISIERVIDNSTIFSKNKTDELHRVIIHGVLHLCGYTDKTPEDTEKIRSAEDLHLFRRPDELKH